MSKVWQYPTEEELKTMILEVDEDGSGEIEFDGALAGLIRLAEWHGQSSCGWWCCGWNGI